MACGCQTAGCGCNVTAGAGILVNRMGDTFIVSNTAPGADPVDPIAADVAYDNAVSGLVADDVQEALDELAARPIAPAALVFQEIPDVATAIAPDTDTAMTTFTTTDFIVDYTLPAATAGRDIIFLNANPGNDIIKFYPASGETLGAGVAEIQPTQQLLLKCMVDGTWLGFR